MGTAVIFVGVVTFLGFTWYFSDSQTTKRLLRGAKRCSIADFPKSGAAKIVGPAQPRAESLVAPLSGRKCVYWKVLVEKKSGRNYYDWLEEEAGTEFQIRDETGVAIIDPTSAAVVLEGDHNTSSGLLDDATAAEELFLQKHGRDSEGVLFNKSLRYSEAIIEVGELVSVLGRGVWEPDPEGQAGAGYREGPAMRLRMNGSAKVPLYISDYRNTTN